MVRRKTGEFSSFCIFGGGGGGGKRGGGGGGFCFSPPTLYGSLLPSQKGEGENCIKNGVKGTFWGY